MEVRKPPEQTAKTLGPPAPDARHFSQWSDGSGGSIYINVDPHPEWKPPPASTSSSSPSNKDAPLTVQDVVFEKRPEEPKTGGSNPCCCCTYLSPSFNLRMVLTFVGVLGICASFPALADILSVSHLRSKCKELVPPCKQREKNACRLKKDCEFYALYTLINMCVNVVVLCFTGVCLLIATRKKIARLAGLSGVLYSLYAIIGGVFAPFFKAQIAISGWNEYIGPGDLDSDLITVVYLLASLVLIGLCSYVAVCCFAFQCQISGGVYDEAENTPKRWVNTVEPDEKIREALTVLQSSNTK